MAADGISWFHACDALLTPGQAQPPPLVRERAATVRPCRCAQVRCSFSARYNRTPHSSDCANEAIWTAACAANPRLFDGTKERAARPERGIKNPQ